MASDRPPGPCGSPSVQPARRMTVASLPHRPHPLCSSFVDLLWCQSWFIASQGAFFFLLKSSRRELVLLEVPAVHLFFALTRPPASIILVLSTPTCTLSPLVKSGRHTLVLFMAPVHSASSRHHAIVHVYLLCGARAFGLLAPSHRRADSPPIRDTNANVHSLSYCSLRAPDFYIV